MSLLYANGRRGGGKDGEAVLKAEEAEILHKKIWVLAVRGGGPTQTIDKRGCDREELWHPKKGIWIGASQETCARGHAHLKFAQPLQ